MTQHHPTLFIGGINHSRAVQEAKPKGAEGHVVARDWAYADKLGVRDAGTYQAYAYFDEGAGFAATSLAEATVIVGKAKIWAGDMKMTDDGKVTIIDDETKNEINFILTGITEDAVVTIDFGPDGYGQGALVPLTAEEAEEIAAAELIAEALGTYVNSLGVLDDGSIIFYTENQEGTQGVVAIVSKDGNDMKVWSGELTTDENGKETVTDEQTKETFSYTWTENKDDGTVSIDSDEYGKGTLVKMSVGDWMAIDELSKELS